MGRIEKTQSEKEEKKPGSERKSYFERAVVIHHC